MASIVYQTLDSLERCLVPEMEEERIKEEKIPLSRHDMKQDQEDKWNHLIFSYSTFTTYKNRCIHFAKYCKKNYDIKKLNEIKSEMVKSYFKDRKENSEWTQKGDYSAISKLENVLKNRNWISKDDSFQVDMEKLPIKDRKLENRKKGGPYSNEELKTIKENVTPNSAKKYIEFIEKTGARISEARKLKFKDINFTTNKIEIKGKGGKVRLVKVDKNYITKIKSLLEDKDINDKILPERTKGAINQAIKNACKGTTVKARGTHSIRANTAVKRYTKLLLEGYSEKEAKKKISKFLGHNRKSVLRYYFTQIDNL